MVLNIVLVDRFSWPQEKYRTTTVLENKSTALFTNESVSDQFECLCHVELWAPDSCKVSHTAVFLLLPPTRDITEGKPLPVEVAGIEYMNDDPASVDVLYAKVKGKDKSDKYVNH